MCIFISTRYASYIELSFSTTALASDSAPGLPVTQRPGEFNDMLRDVFRDTSATATCWTLGSKTGFGIRSAFTSSWAWVEWKTTACRCLLTFAFAGACGCVHEKRARHPLGQMHKVDIKAISTSVNLFEGPFAAVECVC